MTVVCGLCRTGLVSGLAVTKGGQLRIQVWNSGDEAEQLTAKTVMVNVLSCHDVGIDAFFDVGVPSEKMYQDGDDWPTWP